MNTFKKYKFMRKLHHTNCVIFNLVENLQEIIVDLLLAGAETTTTTMRFFMFYMCKYPRVQDNCRKEIGEVCLNHIN